MIESNARDPMHEEHHESRGPGFGARSRTTSQHLQDARSYDRQGQGLSGARAQRARAPAPPGRASRRPRAPLARAIMWCRRAVPRGLTPGRPTPLFSAPRSLSGRKQHATDYPVLPRVWAGGALGRVHHFRTKARFPHRRRLALAQRRSRRTSWAACPTSSGIPEPVEDALRRGRRRRHLEDR